MKTKSTILIPKPAPLLILIVLLSGLLSSFILPTLLQTESRLKTQIFLPESQYPYASAADSTLHKVYVTAVNPNYVYVIDTTTDMVIKTLSWPVEPRDVAIDTDKHKVYVSNYWDHSVTVIDEVTDTVLKTIIIENGYFSSPTGLAVIEHLDKLFVNISYGHSVGLPAAVAVIDTNSDTVQNIIWTNSPTQTGIAVNPVTNRVYSVSGANYIPQDGLTVIDGETETVVAAIHFDDFISIFGVGFDIELNHIYLTAAVEGKVLVLDGDTNQIIEVITTALPGYILQPREVAVDSELNKVYIGNYCGSNLGGSISIINTWTHTKIQELSIIHEYIEPFSDGSMSVDTILHKVYVPLYSHSIVSLVEEANYPPVVAPLVSDTLNEGDTYLATGSFTDDDSISWSATVDYGDGSGIIPIELNPDKTFSLSHTYMDDGIYQITVAITDNGGLTGIGQPDISVNNVAPIVTRVIVTNDPIQLGTSIEARAPFVDPGADTWTVVWDWGDDSNSQGTVSSFNAYGNHTYSAPGVYTITAAIVDDDGGIGTSTYQYIVVYDPTGGFVTGGGWFTSPLGAYTPNPALTGKATFGFVSKYQKGAKVPTGNTEFQFHVANLNFKSISYDWLVIAGSKAQYKGTGTINGMGDYGFMLTATDGTPDKFRIKIWDKITGEIIYDNMLGIADDDNPTTAIGGGSIIIHKEK